VEHEVLQAWTGLRGTGTREAREQLLRHFAAWPGHTGVFVAVRQVHNPNAEAAHWPLTVWLHVRPQQLDVYAPFT
jgi:hypothetical protein